MNSKNFPSIVIIVLALAMVVSIVFAAQGTRATRE